MKVSICVILRVLGYNSYVHDCLRTVMLPGLECMVSIVYDSIVSSILFLYLNAILKCKNRYQSVWSRVQVLTIGLGLTESVLILAYITDRNALFL